MAHHIGMSIVSASPLRSRRTSPSWSSCCPAFFLPPLQLRLHVFAVAKTLLRRHFAYPLLPHSLPQRCGAQLPFCVRDSAGAGGRDHGSDWRGQPLAGGSQDHCVQRADRAGLPGVLGCIQYHACLRRLGSMEVGVRAENGDMRASHALARLRGGRSDERRAKGIMHIV